MTITYIQNWLKDEQRFFEILKENLPFQERMIKIHGKTIPMPRLISYHGDVEYEYSGQTHNKTPLTKELIEIRDRIEKDTGFYFNSCLANLYRDGKDSVSPHSDDEKGLEPTIASVSLGAARRFLIQPKNKSEDSKEFLLGKGDLLIMHAGIQETHNHWVPKTKKKVGERINLTFRMMKE